MAVESSDAVTSVLSAMRISSASCSHCSCLAPVRSFTVVAGTQLTRSISHPRTASTGTLGTLSCSTRPCQYLSLIMPS